MYVSLCNRSAYSFGSALTTPRQLVEFAAAHGMPAVALTDLNGLYAAVQFQQGCHAAGIKPIFGAELRVAITSAVQRIPSRRHAPGESLRLSDREGIPREMGTRNDPRSSRASRSRTATRFQARGSPNAEMSIILLACDLVGYGNLCRLIALHHLRDEGLGINDLNEHAAGLICLLSGTAVADADDELPSLRGAFSDRLYIELFIHQPSDTPLARRRARFADGLGLPVVATCQSRCLRREDGLILKALASIGTLTLLDQPHPDKPLGDWHLRTPAEMARLFARRPDALTNTLAIAEQCNVTLDLSRDRFPAFASPDGRGAIEHLRDLAVAGCRRRYVDEPPLRGIGGYRPTLDEALARLNRELSIIEQVHYAEYFLVFHEIAEYCRREGISFLARGSAADSLVCYALGVSHACPFRFDLPFDRFINPERAKFSKMADIDLDLPWDQRDQVIRWVYDRWGHDRVAMIGAPNTFHARAAVAELGKVYGLPAHEVNRVTKHLPRSAAWNLAEAIAQSPEAEGLIETAPPFGTATVNRAATAGPLRREAMSRVTERSPHTVAGPFSYDRGPDRANRLNIDEPYATILKLACQFEGLPRHWAMHPCGLVVSPEPLTDLVPAQRSPKGMLVAQYDMDAVEDLGFVKVDLLGQAGLSVLRDAVDGINGDANEECRIENAESGRGGSSTTVDLNSDVDYSDPATWSMIARGEARGVHHIESPAMTSLLQQCNCRDIDCLTAVVAVIRPGAANQGKKEAFARRYQGLEAPSYAHPSLKGALEKTYGLMVFEEHILLVATEFAGMNLGRADVLRRALSKHDAALVAELKSEFHAAALLKGRRPREINAVWPLLEGFAGFMFNKAHSAEYAVEAFQGAWLKLRWPAHYIAAILSNYRGFYAGSPTLPQILYVMEARRLGIGFLPPCVNRSTRRFHVERQNEKCRIKNLEAGAAEADVQGCLDLPAPRAASFSILNSTSSTSRRLAIRIPVSHIAGLSQSFLDRHLAARADGPFASLEDFVQRCRPGDTEAQSLLDAGAFDCFSGSRPAMFWQLRKSLSQCPVAPPSRRRAHRRDAGATGSARWCENPFPHPPPQESLLVSSQGNEAGQDDSSPPVALTEPDAWQIARREMDLLGFPITIDPLTFLGRDIDWSRYVPVAELNNHHRRRVTVCGLMVADRLNPTQTGDLMKFITLADYTGFVEAVLFPHAYQRFGHLAVAHPILAGSGFVEPFENGNGFTLRLHHAAPPRRRGSY